MITHKLYAIGINGKTNSAGGKIVKLPLLHAQPKVIYKGKAAALVAENARPNVTEKISLTKTHRDETESINYL